MFRVSSAVFLCFSRVSIGIERGKKSLVFWVVFLGFCLNLGMEDQGGVPGTHAWCPGKNAPFL